MVVAERRADVGRDRVVALGHLEQLPARCSLLELLHAPLELAHESVAQLLVAELAEVVGRHVL